MSKNPKSKFSKARENFSTQLAAIVSGSQPEGQPTKVEEPKSVRENPRFNFRHIGHLPSCGRWKGDGVDHINITKQKPATELGQTLNTNFSLVFHHDVFGEQISISRLWDQIDGFVGEKSVRVPEAELFFILADAMWQKVCQYPLLAESLTKETLPLDMYSFDDNDFPFRSALSWWWLEALYAIQAALRTKAQYPNFKGLIRGKVTDRNKILTNFLKTFVPNRRGEAEKMEKVETPETAPAPSLVKQLRETPPVVFGMKRFAQNLAKPRKEAPAPKVETAPVVETPQPAADAIIEVASKVNTEVVEIVTSVAAEHDKAKEAAVRQAGQPIDTEVFAEAVAGADKDVNVAIDPAVPGAEQTALDGDNVPSQERGETPQVVIMDDAGYVGEPQSSNVTGSDQEAVQVVETSVPVADAPDHANDERFALPGNMDNAISEVQPTKPDNSYLEPAVEVEVYTDATLVELEALQNSTEKTSEELMAGFKMVLNNDELFNKAIKDTEFDLNFDTNIGRVVVSVLLGEVTVRLEQFPTQETEAPEVI